MTEPLRVAGIAGGVGTTLVATLIGGTDIGRDTEHANVIVARNDYRCAKALVEHVRDDQKIVLIIEPGRALLVGDIEAAIGRTVDAAIYADPAIARSDDAGLIESHHGPVSRLRSDLLNTLS